VIQILLERELLVVLVLVFSRNDFEKVEVKRFICVWDDILKVSLKEMILFE